MRAGAIFVCIAVACSIPRAASSATLAIAPLSGKNATSCTRAVRELAAELATIEAWRSKGEERPPSTWDELSKWLREREDEINVDAVVLGSAASRELILEIYDPRRIKLMGVRRFAVQPRCKLSGEERAEIARWMRGVLGISAAAPESTSEWNVLGGDEPIETKPMRIAPDVTSTTEAAGVEARAQDEARLPSEARAEPPRRDDSIGSVELEVALARRSFGYSSPRTENLRGYDIAGMPVPGLRAVAHPLVHTGIQALAPIFAEVRYRVAIGVESSRSEGGPDHGTTFFDLAARLGYRWRAPASALTLAPYAGYHRTSFLLHAPDSGREETDLPNVGYSSVELGAEGELELSERITGFASAAYLVVLSAGEVFTRAFFANGTALGLDFEAGMRIEVAPELAIVAAGSYLAYALSLDAARTDTRSADSANDACFFLKTGVRLAF